jgi:hypothetical protein
MDVTNTSIYIDVIDRYFLFSLLSIFHLLLYCNFSFLFNYPNNIKNITFYKMPRMYCGNQANFPGLVAGTHVLGTNYECLRRGIGVGSHLPYDNSYAQPHVPVDARRFYCGNNPAAPVGYFTVGSPSKCQQIGIGVGKAQRAALGPPFAMYFIRFVLPYLLFLLLVGGIFVIFYFTKPKFLIKKDPNMNKIVIDWSKFLPYYAVACLIVAIIIWWFWKMYIRRLI